MRRSRDPQVKEDAFQLLRTQAADLVTELRTAYKAETDHGTKCWLLELLGQTRDPSLEDLFHSVLDGPDDSLCRWAERGLQNLDTKTARTILWRHSRGQTSGA